MTKVHSYKNKGSFGTSWLFLNEVLTKELQERVVLDKDEFICINNIELDPEKYSILFEYSVFTQEDVEEDE